MKKFNIEDYINGNKILINSNTLIEEYWMSKRSSELLIRELIDKWLVIKINRWNYIFINQLNKIDNHELIMLLDPNSYIWIYTVLERQLIKQAHTKTFALSNSNNVKNEDIIDNRRIEFKNINIPTTFGMEIRNRVRYSDMERSLLDLIYLHVFTGYPITSELYLTGNINEDKIEKYLKYYPDRVANFYYNKLYEYAK